MRTRENFLKYESLEVLQETFKTELHSIRIKKNIIATARDKQKYVTRFLPRLEEEGANIIEDLNISNNMLAESQKAVKFSEPLLERLKSKVREMCNKSDNVVLLFENLASVQKLSEDLGALGKSIRYVDRVELIEKHVIARTDLLTSISLIEHGTILK